MSNQGWQRQSDDLFVTARGAAMTRQAFWQLIKRYAVIAGIDAARLSPHVLCATPSPRTS